MAYIKNITIAKKIIPLSPNLFHFQISNCHKTLVIYFALEF